MDTELSAWDMGARGEALEDCEPEPQWFIDFMKLYPKQENRTAACREARRLAPTLELQATILRAVRALRASERWQKGFAPDAKNFLRDRRWRDADGLPGYSPGYGTVTGPGSAGTVYKTKQVKLDLPVGEKCDPEVAKAAMREGIVEGWKERHPAEEPPAALLQDPVGYITGRAKDMKPGAIIQADTAETRRQAMAELESVKHRMRGDQNVP